MKVIVVSSSYPYPVDIGRKVVIAGFIDYLVSAFGGENVTFACIARASGSSPPLPCQHVPLILEGIGWQAPGLAWQSLIRGRRALQEMILYSRRVAKQFGALVRSIAPDIIIVDTIRLAQYVEPYADRVPRSILYLDDLYSLRYRRLLAAMDAYPEAVIDSVGTFGRFLPRALRRAARGRRVQRWLLHLESRLLEKREAELPRQFRSALLLNRDEAARLSRRSGAKNVVAVKPLLREHRTRLPRQHTCEPTFLFLGNLQYAANACSLSLFMKQTMPRLIEADRRAKLIVVGRGGDAGLKQQSRLLNGHVEFLDFVEDLAPLAATAAGMVVPLIYGSGLKLKVLDALYYGLPIVSTSCGVDGIGATDGPDFTIEDDLSAFVEPMMQLLDPDVNDRMSTASERLFAEQFAPEVVRSEYAEIFGTA
jgi:glycosyltransferase involved in cell wall biosynthesis